MIGWAAQPPGARPTIASRVRPRTRAVRSDHARPERVEARRQLVYLDRLGIAELYGIEPQRDAVERVRARRPDFHVMPDTQPLWVQRDAASPTAEPRLTSA